jgi:hypothetical protein
MLQFGFALCWGRLARGLASHIAECSAAKKICGDLNKSHNSGQMRLRRRMAALLVLQWSSACWLRQILL